jgi:uncharacterized protein YndB with AHSA1/START domain
MSDHIEKSIELNAPVERVWRALTDHTEFGTWFGVKLAGPFQPGELSTGHMTISGFEHVKWAVTVKKMEKPHLFSFTWHPYAIEPGVDYSGETPTLVEFKLEPKGQRTLLTVNETGFSALPSHRQPDALRMNTRGWAQQLENIKTHVE